MIAGEGLVGILLAVFAIFGIDKVINLSRFVPATVAQIGGIVLFLAIILIVLKVTIWKKRKIK
jgi:predicted membrane-bound spermidine synthase